jgi:hypothetical protein
LQSILNYFDWSNLGDLLIRVVAVFLCISTMKSATALVHISWETRRPSRAAAFRLTPASHRFVCTHPDGRLWVRLGKPEPLTCAISETQKRYGADCAGSAQSNSTPAFLALFLAGRMITHTPFIRRNSIFCFSDCHGGSQHRSRNFQSDSDSAA